MTRLYRMGDSSTPPGKRTNLPVYAFYLHGNTPHVWSQDEIRALDSRWGLPISVQTDQSGDAAGDAAAYADALRKARWAPHTTVALDTENVVMPHYISEFSAHMTAAGWTLMHYESIAAEPGNPDTPGGKWIPDWDGVAELPPGAVAAQYQSAAQSGTPWDQSVISAQVHLGEIHPVAIPDVTEEQLYGSFPVLAPGARGWAVHMLQALLVRAFQIPADPNMEDGVFGPVTGSWLQRWQQLYGVTTDQNYAGAETIESLLTRT